MSIQQDNSSQCLCGAVSIATVSAPICRAYCHCTICRNFNKTDYADVTVFRENGVESFDESLVEFKFFKKPNWVSRGRCATCNDPVIERVTIPLMPKLLIIPSANFNEADKLPSPLVHIFYDKRVVDVDDGLPKHHGFVSSQIAFSRELMKGMLNRS